MSGLKIEWKILFEMYAKKRYKTCLEIGASTKWKTDALARNSEKVTGIELFLDRMPLDNNNIKYICGDWVSLTEYTGSNVFDVVVSCHVIEHIEKDLIAINQLYHALKAGGLAFITTPNRKRLIRRIIEIFTGPRIFPHWEHVREYDFIDITELIERSLFESAEVVPCGLGFHARWFQCYIPCPIFLKDFAAVWLIKLKK
jgi:2-polyprenyl-3-methyl-5-hydroxy-6-metoxy-1,4-benzoquinol methylase